MAIVAMSFGHVCAGVCVVCGVFFRAREEERRVYERARARQMTCVFVCHARGDVTRGIVPRAAARNAAAPAARPRPRRGRPACGVYMVLECAVR